MARMELFALALVALPALAAADVVELKSGGRIEGQIVSESATRVVVDVSAGQVTIPRSTIARLHSGASALAEYRRRAALLRAGDVAGWMALGGWARDSGLQTQSREAFEHVLALQPGHAAAHEALGHVFMAGRWMSEDESYRSRGYVQFEGTWVRPEERRAILEDRVVAEAASRERAESSARVREAEARADAAEAEADRARAASDAQANTGGIPLDPYVYGGGYGGGYGYGYTGPVVQDPGTIPPPVVVDQAPERRRHHGEGTRPQNVRTPGSSTGMGGNRQH